MEGSNPYLRPMALRDFLPFLGKPAPLVAVIRLDGVISARGRQTLSLANLAPQIRRAFSRKGLAAVALAINSPGGAPAQSQLIYSRIRQLATEKNVPVLAFVEDVAASGGYWLALSGDEIFAEETSLVGSIGVITASFGFTDLIQRLGIERRVYTAGKNKSLLDPFRPESSEDVERLKAIQQDMHDSFKELVRARRGVRLSQEKDLFTGDIFTGRMALKYGLIDGIGDLRGIARRRFGDKVRLRVISPQRGWFRMRLPFLSRGHTTADIAADLLAQIEERLAWSRFGL